jgi:hypothetical protein
MNAAHPLTFVDAKPEWSNRLQARTSGKSPIHGVKRKRPEPFGSGLLQLL